MELDWLWRKTTRDAVCAPPLNAVTGTAGRGGRFTGRQAIAGLDWRATRHLTFMSQYVHFTRGGGLRPVNGRSVDFLFGSADYRF